MFQENKSPDLTTAEGLILEIQNRIFHQYGNVDGSISFPNSYDGDLLKMAHEAAELLKAKQAADAEACKPEPVYYGVVELIDGDYGVITEKVLSIKEGEGAKEAQEALVVRLNESVTDPDLTFTLLTFTSTISGIPLNFSDPEFVEISIRESARQMLFKLLWRYCSEDDSVSLIDKCAEYFEDMINSCPEMTCERIKAILLDELKDGVDPDSGPSDFRCYAANKRRYTEMMHNNGLFFKI